MINRQQSLNPKNSHNINEESSSDDEENRDRISVLSPVAISQSQRTIRMISTNETPPRLIIDEPSINIDMQVTKKIISSDQSLSVQQYVDVSQTFDEEKPADTVNKRKRKQHRDPCSSITAPKQSARLAAKRVRIT